MTDPRSYKPAYREVADALRSKIAAGEYEPGDQLPSEAKLQTEYDVSRITARSAIDLLRQEGLVVVEHGRGVFVRKQPPVRRIASERYASELQRLSESAGGEHPMETAFTREHGVEWEDFQVDTAYEVIPAPDDVAEALHLPEGTEVLRRYMVLRAKGAPQQIRYSYYRADLVAGTPVADPDVQPWPGGTLAELAGLGIRVTTVIERIRSRPPSPEEAHILDMFGAAVPVFELYRVFIGEDGPAEATWPMIMPANHNELVYQVDLTGQAERDL
ncbi:MAG: GntR family transcriptional regulator [Micromonosporaceae bacterium]